MNDYGYKKVAAAVIDVAIGDPRANLESILAVSRQTDADIIVFPELSITGYTCGELFRQSLLLRETERALASLAEATDKLRGKLIAVGAPLRCGGRLYNCAVFAANGAILGAVPKTHIPNYSEFYEARWFSSGNDCREDSIRIGERDYPFGTDLIFREENGTLAVGAEICEDLWVPSPPSGNLAQLGANVIVNLSASNEVLSKSEYRRDLVRMQSARCVAGYVYASAGIGESTSDLVFSGHSLICDNGAIVAETRYENRTITGVIDIERLENERQRMNTFTHGASEARGRVVTYVGSGANRLPESVNAYPFIPADRDERQRRCREILALQSNGLATRLKKTGIKTVVLGISGGVDSTLAIIVAVEAFHLLGLDTKGIIAVTMPGFGTTGRTYGNALELIEKLGAQCRTVPIADACMQHFSDIGHDPSIHDVTYENTQARERTQILMDIANKENGLVIGTGDLSELALGWCTYNGDHMSMYGVNCGVPKTLAKYVISAYGQMHPEYAAVLEEILDTPISPELLPADDNGEIAQKTEEKLGKYDLHDFILFHVLRNGFAPEKIFALGKIAFPDVPVQELQRAMETFYRRFFTQQFKRNCLPDGVKVGSVCLSPRGDWRMPSEASGRLWLDDLTENL
jgi:NAD+ synthase (glutamine-hydrolysing)